MNLLALTNYVCDKTGQVEDADRTAAQSFLSKRYELIWNSYLWKDSLIPVDIAFDPSDDNNAAGIILCPEIIDRVVAFRTSENSIRIKGLEDYYRVDADKFPMTGTAYEGVLLSPIWFVWRGTTGLKIISQSEDDASGRVKVIWSDANGVQTVTTINLNSTTPPTIDGAYIQLESVFKPATTGSVAFNPQVVGEDAGGTLLATATRSPSYQRIRLFSIPTAAVTLNVLGKKKFVPLDFDQEEPAIKNLDNCLIAFACADMQKRARQYAKSNEEMQEGVALLQELAKLETVQAANNQVIRPDDGFGDIYNPRVDMGIFW